MTDKDYTFLTCTKCKGKGTCLEETEIRECFKCGDEEVHVADDRRCWKCMGYFMPELYKPMVFNVLAGGSE